MIFFIFLGNVVAGYELEQRAFDYTDPVSGVLHLTYFYAFKYESSLNWEENVAIVKQYSFGNYTPKNNKLKCYPYNYLYVSNLAGENEILKMENFSESVCNFANIFTISVGGSRAFSSEKL